VPALKPIGGGYLRALHCIGCASAILGIDSDGLDQIVQSGLQSRALGIR
jgi:hypothetical protein